MLRFLLTLFVCSSTALTLVPHMPAGAVTFGGSAVLTRGAGEVTMGRGDKRTTKGKRKAKSFGVARPRNSELRKRKDEAAKSAE